ncbi:MAG: SpoIIE family protein phosphatase [Acidobacteriota bacterium]
MNSEMDSLRKQWSRPVQDRYKDWWRRRSRVAKLSVALLAMISLCSLASTVHVARGADQVLELLGWTALAPLLLVLFFRWFAYRVLWKVRNRLILTYLLMGLAPVVMVLTLTSVAAYMLAGQYATDMGLLSLKHALARVRDEAGSAAVYGTQRVEPGLQKAAPAKQTDTGTDTGAADNASSPNDLGMLEKEDATPLALLELRGGAWVERRSGARKLAGPLAGGVPPKWLHPGFKGIVEQNRRLYLCAEVSAPHNGKMVTVLASRALTRAELNVLANGLGRIILSHAYSHLADYSGTTDVKVDKDTDVRVATPDSLFAKGGEFDAVSSAPLAPSRHPYLNPPILASPVTLPVTSWRTGENISGLLAVISRPRLLYGKLFASSGTIGAFVKWLLLGLAAFFALLETFALLMAFHLSWTITRSVAELYEGTREIDAGHLQHRIPVRRKDQLAALAGSFNRMAESVSELLVQQQEKDRLLHELAIAQEVQATLFPSSPAKVGSLEVHGTCLPARSVGGDYFDFIFGYGRDEGQEGTPSGHVTLALGDISGKGISAALLMSALHSADRAFSAAALESGAMVSPAQLLRMLNEHLHRSTQSSRYATLFLATYDPATRRLTYSNGGHLPPLVISADGSVRRLEEGGAVVGLLEGIEYEQATVVLQPGDLLVAYTDGLTEPERDEQEFGEQRLMEFVRARRNEPLTTLAAHMLEVVKEWIGDQEQPDDMTVVLARQN